MHVLHIDLMIIHQGILVCKGREFSTVYRKAGEAPEDPERVDSDCISWALNLKQQER